MLLLLQSSAITDCLIQAPAIVETEKVLGKTKSGRITKGPAKPSAPAKKTGPKKTPVKKSATPKKKAAETPAA